MREKELCKVDGHSGHPWADSYKRWTCTHWKNHKGKHSWEAEGRYKV